MDGYCDALAVRPEEVAKVEFYPALQIVIFEIRRTFFVLVVHRDFHGLNFLEKVVEDERASEFWVLRILNNFRAPDLYAVHRHHTKGIGI